MLRLSAIRSTLRFQSASMSSLPSLSSRLPRPGTSCAHVHPHAHMSAPHIYEHVNTHDCATCPCTYQSTGWYGFMIDCFRIDCWSLLKSARLTDVQTCAQPWTPLCMNRRIGMHSVHRPLGIWHMYGVSICTWVSSQSWFYRHVYSHSHGCIDMCIGTVMVL